MPNLTPEDILRLASPIQVEPVEVPEWGGTVYLASPSSARRDAAEQALWKDGQQDLSNFRARIVALCLAFPDGKPWYADPIAGAEDLGRCDSRVIRRLYRLAKRMCPVTDEDLDALEKN